jgi:hypothetical protein
MLKVVSRIFFFFFLHVLLIAEPHDELQKVHLDLDVGGIVAHKET